MAALRPLLALLFLILYLPLAALVAFPWTLLSGSAELLYKVGMIGARTAVRLAGIKIKNEGRDHLYPAKNHVFMAHHISNPEPPGGISAGPPRTPVLVEKKLFRIPIFGK